jgi:hypothetical protein
LIDQHTVVVCVRYQQVTLAVERKPRRITMCRVGCSPSPQVTAIAIEDLNARRGIYNVESILGVNGDSAGFLELTTATTEPAPN